MKKQFYKNKTKWGTRIEKERRRRIKLAIWAYAYEIENDSIVTDEIFDKESYLVDESIKTGNKKLDDFFVNEFEPCTGSWIHQHPELDKIRKIYNDYFSL